MAIIQTPNILLLGGGYTLSRLAKTLAEGSFVITSRSQNQCDEWSALGWHSARVSLTDPTTIRSTFERFPSIDSIVDSVPPIREGTRPSIGVENLVCEAKALSIKRFIYLSTTGVYGVRDGSWVDETTPTGPWNALGTSRLECEEAYRASENKSTSLRLPAIYGPHRGLEKSLANGTYRIIGDGNKWTNRIHVTDLVTIISRVLQTSTLPEVLCVSDNEPSLAREVVGFYCSKFNLAIPPSISTEEAMARGSFTMLSNQRISNLKMRELLGEDLRYPSFREGSTAPVD